MMATGCEAGSTFVRDVPAAYPSVFRAAERAVAPAPIEASSSADGRIETGCSEALAPETRGYLLEAHFIERRRFRIRLAPKGASTEVALSVRVDRRAPGGTQSIRWERADPARAAEEFWRRLDEELAR